MPDWPNISELPGLYSELPEEFAETDAEPAGHFPPLAALHAVWDTEDAARAMPDEVNEDAFASEEFVEAEPAPAIEPEPAPLEPAPVVPGSTSSGHGLRAAMLQSTEAKPTFAGRVATLLVRLRDWLRRHTR